MPGSISSSAPAAASGPASPVRNSPDPRSKFLVFADRLPSAYGAHMKMTLWRMVYGLAAAGWLAGAASGSAAEEKTAFELIKEGNRHVGEDAKDKVVQIRSEKSLGTLTPNIWYVVYYDVDATTKATQVKFGGGVKLEVKRQFRLFEMAGKAHLPLEREKLKVDSNQAIEVATGEPMLKNLKVVATRLTL